MEDIDPEIAGVVAGYENERGVPACPYPLWAPLGPDRKRRSRHPDRDLWFRGYRVGRELRFKHKSELQACVTIIEKEIKGNGRYK